MSGKLFVVVRLGFEVDDYTPPREKILYEPEVAESGGMPVAAFPDRESAMCYRRELEAKGRREIGVPMRFDQWEYGADPDVSGGDELAYRLMELGIDPPEPIQSEHGVYFDNWLRWWDAVAETVTEQQRDALWDLAPKLRLYDIRELELGD